MRQQPHGSAVGSGVDSQDDDDSPGMGFGLRQVRGSKEVTYCDRTTVSARRLQPDHNSPVSVATRPDWDTYFLDGAAWAATRADCTRRKVGAILVNARNEVRGVGYNGAPAGIPGCASAGACPRGKLSSDDCAPGSDYSNCIADHAERNALRHADPAELAGGTLYVTDEPCPSCWTLIRAAGIRQVVTPHSCFTTLIEAKDDQETCNCRNPDYCAERGCMRNR